MGTLNKKRLLSIEDLVKFCEEQKLYNFNSNENGYKLCVQVPATFEVDEALDNDHRGMLKLKFRIFHTGVNRNGSYVSEDAAKEAMPTIKNRPILAYIHKLDNGEWDFESHNMEYIENEDGSFEIEYLEKQIGSFDESEPFFEYDEETEKTYVCGYGYISEEYTRAADIIREKNGTKNSCELSIEEFAYDAKNRYLDLKKFYVSGSTLLGSRADGTEVKEGMEGSRADIADFSEKNNSLFSNCNEELLHEIKRLNENLSLYNKEKSKEGGQPVKFEELLEKYGKTLEDVSFEYENMTDEELESKFEEVFGEEDTAGEGEDPTSEGEEVSDEVETEEVETEVEEEVKETETTEEQAEVFENLVRTYEISHDDVRYALYQLLAPYEEADNEWYYISAVYDTYFVYESWSESNIYGQKYTKENDEVSFSEERFNLHRELLTDAEYTELMSMRSNYEAMKSQLEAYQLAEQNALKDALFLSDEYSSISDKAEFEELKANHAEFSLDELKTKLDGIILDYAKKNCLRFNYEETEVKNKVVHQTKLPINTKSSKKSRYGSLKFN